MSKNPETDNFINLHSGWQKDNLITFRKLVHESIPNIEEDFKWSCPVFLLNGKLICAMSVFKDHTKFNFFNGALIKDESKIFNSGLDSKKHRSINLAESEKINETALKQILKFAAELN